MDIGCGSAGYWRHWSTTRHSQNVSSHRDNADFVFSTLRIFLAQHPYPNQHLATVVTASMSFDLAERLTRHHLIVQPSDLALNPPQSYLFVQDFLIISCGVIYALCYVFYIARTYKDRTMSGPVEYLYAPPQTQSSVTQLTKATVAEPSRTKCTTPSSSLRRDLKSEHSSCGSC